MKIDLKKLGLPEDVIVNSGFEIDLVGDIKHEKDEIIIITQLFRSVICAYVCHAKLSEERKCSYDEFEVLDLPGFKRVVFNGDNISIKSIDGSLYTMACCVEKDHEYTIGNWLY